MTGKKGKGLSQSERSPLKRKTRRGNSGENLAVQQNGNKKSHAWQVGAIMAGRFTFLQWGKKKKRKGVIGIYRGGKLGNSIRIFNCGWRESGGRVKKESPRARKVCRKNGGGEKKGRQWKKH